MSTVFITIYACPGTFTSPSLRRWYNHDVD